MLIVVRNVVGIVLLMLTLACAARAESSRWSGPRVINGSFGEQLCGKHRQQLERVTVFGPGGGVCVLVQPSKKMARQLARSPNALSVSVHRKPDQLYSRRVQLWYCVRCEEEVERPTSK